MTALRPQLERHLDGPDSRHRLVLLAPDRLRCLDCTQTIDLRPALAAVPGTTSTSKGLPHPDESCPKHPGEWPDACGRCRSERIAARLAQPNPFTPTADVAAGAARARAAIRRQEQDA